MYPTRPLVLLGPPAEHLLLGAPPRARTPEAFVSSRAAPLTARAPPDAEPFLGRTQSSPLVAASTHIME